MPTLSQPGEQSAMDQHDEGPRLTDVRMHVARPDAPVVARVVENRRCTASRKSAHFVHHITFDVSGSPLAGAFRSGQSFGVIPPGVDEKGRPHRLRLYSLSSPTRGEDGAGTVVATTVKRTIEEDPVTDKLYLGVASNFLCDAQPGDEVRLTGPNGKRFVLPGSPGDHDYVFFATGTGIAPFRGMLLDLFESGAASRVVLVMGSAYASDLLYHEDLQAWAGKHPNFTYLTAISRERQADGGPPMYVQDRLGTHAGLFRDVFASDRALVYVCGLAGMELGIFRALAGVLDANTLGRYLRVDPEVAADPASWDRRMIHKQVAPTRRVFLEVY